MMSCHLSMKYQQVQVAATMVGATGAHRSSSAVAGRCYRRRWHDVAECRPGSLKREARA